MKSHINTVIAVTIIVLLFTSCKGNSTEEFYTDAARFKYEYESVNGKIDDHDHKSRIVDISEDNPMVYSSYTDICSRMDAEETFAVYFGFAKCPWCRGCIEALLESASDCGIKTIYYVDVYTSRDTYELVGNELKMTTEGAEGYELILDKMEAVLPDYTLINDDNDEIFVGEKRVYAPSLVIVKNGIAIGIASDSELFTDPYGTITQEIYDDMKTIYTSTFSLMQ